MTALLEKFNA